VTNKVAVGRKGMIVTLFRRESRSCDDEVRQEILEKHRRKITEITLDMAGIMELIAKGLYCCS
jgi:transposase